MSICPCSSRSRSYPNTVGELVQLHRARMEWHAYVAGFFFQLEGRSCLIESESMQLCRRPKVQVFSIVCLCVHRLQQVRTVVEAFFVLLHTPGLLPPLNEESVLGLKEVLVAGVRGASEAIVLCTGMLTKPAKEGTAPGKEEGDRDKGGCVIVLGHHGWLCRRIGAFRVVVS